MSKDDPKIDADDRNIFEVLNERKYTVGTLSPNILKIGQHEGAELFDGSSLAGRARETDP